MNDKSIVQRIVDEINPSESELLVEIGPGHGVMTEHLLKANPTLTAVEIDRRLAAELRITYPALDLVEGDILDFDLSEFAEDKNALVRLVGNIPYNISSQILFLALEHRRVVKDVIIMVQLEVGQRIVASHGNKTYGILSVLLQSVADAKICFVIPPEVFFPKPKVDSCLLRITFTHQEENFNFPIFKKVVKAAFLHRRKTLKNSLQSGLGFKEELAGSPIDLTKRAEQLSINDFIILANYFEEIYNRKKLS